MNRIKNILTIILLLFIFTTCDLPYEIYELQGDDESNFDVEVVNNNTAVHIINYTGNKKALIIPKTINNMTVVGIGHTSGNSWQSGFGDKGLTEIIIPDTVTFVGRWAFIDNRLMNINIPNSVTVIGEWSFRGNNLINCIEIQPNINKIMEMAFSDNLIKEVIINGNTIIEKGAFSDNLIKSVTILSSGASIDTGSFTFNRIERINIAANVIVHDKAFDNDFGLFYNSNGCKAGTYVLINGNWVIE